MSETPSASICAWCGGLLEWRVSHQHLCCLNRQAEKNGAVEEEFAYSRVIDLLAEALNEAYVEPTPGKKAQP